MKKVFTKVVVTAAALVALACSLVLMGFTDANVPMDEGEVRILFTHDIHSYLDTTEGIVGGELREYGNIARLSTLLKHEENNASIYVDGGDIAMGTLYQAAFATDAYELRILGELGCSYVTFGNHEFDYGCSGVTGELKAAMASGDKLPKLVESSFNFMGTLTEEQQELKDTLDEYGMQEYFIEEVNGIKLGFFALEGPDSIECIQADVDFDNYITVAKRMVAELQDKCDVIIALSHTGTSGDGETGEDFDMLKEVQGIDVVISAHSHSIYTEPVYVNDGETVLVSAGSYLMYLGELDLKVEDGKVTVTNYRLIDIDENVEEDPEIRAKLEEYKKNIKETYLETYAEGGDYDDVLVHSDFDFISLDEMYATHQEYTTGDLIADSYKYMAGKNGIDDIDVYLVGLGTIRGSILEGDVTLADAFEICSLGVGGDGSAGHPLVTAYITGQELKLLVELDASLGPLVSSIKMSYAGLNYTFNTARAILDRVTEVYLVDDDGDHIEIEDDRLYKVCCNMYAANMLGMLNGLTRGILKIVPKAADGSVISDFYSVTMKTAEGLEIKEWVAFKEYLESFEDGKIPEVYASAQGRKNKVTEHGVAAIENPGIVTIVLCVLGWILILHIFLMGRKHRKRYLGKKAGTYVKPSVRRKQKRAERKARKAAKKAGQQAAGGAGDGCPEGDDAGNSADAAEGGTGEPETVDSGTDAAEGRR